MSFSLSLPIDQLTLMYKKVTAQMQFYRAHAVHVHNGSDMYNNIPRIERFLCLTIPSNGRLWIGLRGTVLFFCLEH
jgi:hypothetical protein